MYSSIPSQAAMLLAGFVAYAVAVVAGAWLAKRVGGGVNKLIKKRCVTAFVRQSRKRWSMQT